jgi:hypothetical protein
MFLYNHLHGWDAKMVRVYNWKKLNKIKENEFEILLKEGIKIVNKSKEPWIEKHYGRRPYPSKAMINICLLKVYFKMPYRDIESFIRSNQTIQNILQLKNVPDHNTIQRAMAKIPMDYLEELNQKLVFNFKKRGQTLPLMQQDSV